jgi:Right handed beta helix region
MQGVPQAPFFTVSNNAAQGVLISNASSVLISGLTSTNNGASGLELSNASGVIVQGTNSMASNAQDGIWLHASSGNQF